MAQPYTYTPDVDLDIPQQIGGVICEIETTAPAQRDDTKDKVTTQAYTPDGAAFIIPHPPQIWTYELSTAAQQTDASVVAAPGANLEVHLTDIYVAAGGAVTITLEEDGTTFKWAYNAQAAGDGAAVSRRVPIILAANKALTITTSAAVQVYVALGGYINPNA
jgi:hypothetical protein